MQKARRVSAGQSISVLSGFPLPVYLGMLLITLAAMYMDVLPRHIVGGFLGLMLLGIGLDGLGKTVPVVRTYLGGSVICILGGAVIRSAGLIPPSAYETLDDFVNRQGFLTFYISALIVGSLFNMDRKLLISGSLRLLPVALTSVAAGMAVLALLGPLTGYSPLEAILFIGIPMTGGGMTAGTVPLSGIYAQEMGRDAGEILTLLAPATVLGNMICVISGALANHLGERHPAWTGQGRLVNDGTEAPEPRKMTVDYGKLTAGLVLALIFYQMGEIGHHFVPPVPTYAWMILLVVGVKGTGRMPVWLEDAAIEWGQFAIKAWTGASLAGIGITLIDLKTILATITPAYLLILLAVAVTVMGSAALLGRLAGFYAIESAIAAGMCTMNMGGSGNVATLSSAERMELLPFAQIVTRTCGAVMLTIGGILAALLH